MKARCSTLASAVTLLVFVAVLSTPAASLAQSSSERTLGLISRDVRASEGYTLSKPFRGFAPETPGLTFYLLNNAGNPVHQWTTPLPTRTGGEMVLRRNGELMLDADDGFFALKPDGSLAWRVELKGLPVPVQRHHEVLEMPNGNMLLPAWIKKTRAEAIQAGFDVAGADLCGRGPLLQLFVDNIWELAPKDRACGFACGWEVVWRWDLWDHIVQDDDPAKANYVGDIADHPGKADIGYRDPAGGVCSQFIQGAWTFGRYNALDYHAAGDEIVISESLFNEIQVIDHAVASSDFIYRWGNPYAYGAGAPFVNAANRGDQELSFQHRVHWIAPGLPGGGNLLIFNNGADWGDSSVVELRLPNETGGYVWPTPGEPFEPPTRVWQYDEYDTPGSFFASFVSSAQRLPNGNTLINNGPKAYFFEVTSQGEKVWEYVYPLAGYPAFPPAQQGSSGSLSAYRAWRYAPDYPGLASLDLVAGDPLEQYPDTQAIDVKPGSCENPVNRESNGTLPVIVLGSAEMDVTTIDPGSIFLEGFEAARASIEDAGTPGECEGLDGIPDLVLKWDSGFIGTALGGLSTGEALVRLTGHSAGGWFLGRDVVTIKK